MRLLATIVVALTLSFGTRTVAQHVAAPQRNTASQEQISAAHALISAIMFDTGILDQAITPMIDQLVPVLRQRATAASAQRGLSAQGQTALAQYLSDLPSYIRSEVLLGAGELVDATAEPASHLFTVEEWHDIAEFVRSASGRTILTKLARGERSSLTTDEISAARAFSETPSGQAYAARGAELNRILYETMNAQMPLISARMLERSHRRFCEMLGDECPTEVRNLIPPN